MSGTYRIVVVNRTGSTRRELRSAEVLSIADELNAPGGVNFRIPTMHADALIPQTLRNEIQVYRDTTLLKWAVPTRRTGDDNTLTWQCAGLWWYFHRRYVGRANRTNWLRNGDFELTGVQAGLGGTFWTAVGVAANIVASHHTSGSQALELIQATPGVDTFAWQRFTVIPNTLFTFVAWLHIYGDHPYSGPALDDRGVYAALIYPTNQVQLDHVAVAPIDGSYQSGHTYRMVCQVPVPADAPAGAEIEVRLYAPGGYVMWDSVTATTMESISFAQADVATVCNTLVAHAQDPSFGKDSLAVVSPVPSPSLAAKLVSPTYQFADHQEIAQQVEAFARSGMLDFDIETTATVRTFKTYSPTKGSARDDMIVRVTGETSDTANLEPDGDDEDGESTDTAVVTLSPDGNGPDREEGYAADVSLIPTILERIIQTEPGTPIDALTPMAAEAVRRGHDIARALTVRYRPGHKALTGLKTGDTVPVVVDRGAIQRNERMRVVRREIRPGDDTVAVTLNPL